MRPLYSVYTAVSVAALLGLTFASFPKVARSGKPMLRCGTYNPTKAEAQRAEYFLNKAMTGKGHVGPALNTFDRFPGSTTVNVFFHIITPKDGSIGNLTDAQVQSQIDEMNKCYSGNDPLPRGMKPLGPVANTPFRFRLVGIDRTADDDYFVKGNMFFPDTEKKMKTALRRGDSRTLNVYTNGLAEVGLLGYATFPSDYQRNPLLDGVVITYDCLPGFPGPYGLGKTLVHETGHWLGLYHPFQDSCTKANDYVEDTPAEAYPFYGSWLPGGNPGYITDTCTGRYFTGKDPVDVYMDYSDDIAYARFTPGEAARMDLMCRIYRNL